MASATESVDFDAENVEVSVTQPTSRQGKRLRSKVWLHFERVTNEDGNVVAVCRYCQKHLVGNSSSGTKHLSNHVMRCPAAQALKKSRGETEFIVGGGDCENTPLVFDNERSREDFAKMVIVHQYPFAMVEHAFFRRYLKNAQPEFQLLSRNTVKSDCMKVFAMEKEKMYSSLESLNCRFSLTSDMWSSINNDGYICLTCHYIDDDWILKKRILNFEYVEAPHGHKEITKVLLDKLLEWNIHKKLFTIVLDNASANNKAVKMLLKDSTFTQFLPLDGSSFHLRCSAHILNLIVQDGLKEVEKYWKKTNTLLAIATILDPRFKLFMVRYFFEKIYGDEVEEKVEEVKIDLQRLYDTYVTRRSGHLFQSRTLNVSSMASVSKRRVGSSSRSRLTSIYMDFSQYLQQSSLHSSEKTDLDVYYLEEPAKSEEDFDILKWWKSNSSKYPILSRMARDVLAIPMSTVASESAFSTGSRVLNKYRSSLDATTVQALICTENWLRDDVSSIDISEEDALSSIFASMKTIDENEDEILEIPYDEAFAFSSASKLISYI